MLAVRIKQIDAFTRQPFRGNPAGVVTDAELLTDEEMQLIAREMNLSETAFVTDSEEADLQLRWFTPTQEVDLCGHATIAAFHALAEEGKFGIEVGAELAFRVETRSGILEVQLDWDEQKPIISFELPVHQFEEAPLNKAMLAEALHLEETDFEANPMKASNGYSYALVKSRELIDKAQPDYSRIRSWWDEYGINALALATVNTTDDVQWDMRFFAPALGVNEDPVTGSANGPMALYLWYQNKLQFNKAGTLKARGLQGRTIGRPGFVEVKAKSNKAEVVTSLYILGRAVTVMDGTLHLEN